MYVCMHVCVVSKLSKWYTYVCISRQSLKSFVYWYIQACKGVVTHSYFIRAVMLPSQAWDQRQAKCHLWWFIVQTMCNKYYSLSIQACMLQCVYGCVYLCLSVYKACTDCYVFVTTMLVWIPPNPLTCMRTCIHTAVTHSHAALTWIYLCIHTYMHTYTHAYRYIHAYIQAHVAQCVCSLTDVPLSSMLGCQICCCHTYIHAYMHARTDVTVVV